ncbi:MAG: hypothetical protein AAF432_15605 [Planctomycetota bacterium]
MQRDPANPIITRTDIPVFMPTLRDVSSVFNPGAIRVGDADLLMLRVQTRGRETILVPAFAHDDGRVEFCDGIATIEGIAEHDERVLHIYDPRLTRIDDDVYMVFAVDVRTRADAPACRLGIARMHSPTQWTLVGIDASRDSRNGVLFPQRINGSWMRLERPNETQLDDGPRTGSAIHVSTSTDLVDWTVGRKVMRGRPHYWDELIGSGPPPVLTDRGWLHVYHGVATHFASSNVYQAGVVLLDADEPSRVIARGAMNILEPREIYELVGQVPNVVFPSGMVVDAGGAVRLYYGCADTCVGRVHTSVDELLALCEEP